jgi:hypothetical protein
MKIDNIPVIICVKSQIICWEGITELYITYWRHTLIKECIPDVVASDEEQKNNFGKGLFAALEILSMRCEVWSCGLVGATKVK